MCKSQIYSEPAGVFPTKTCFTLIATCKICHTSKTRVNNKFTDNCNSVVILGQEIKRPKHEVETEELKCKIANKMREIFALLYALARVNARFLSRLLSRLSI